MTRYPLFPREQLQLKSFRHRGHDLRPEDCLPLTYCDDYEHPDLRHLMEAIRAARRADRPVVLMMGAHPIKLGLSRFLIDLVEQRWVTHVATNGAGAIHDYELALGEGTSENVPYWIQRGQFGLWQETSGLNEIVREAASRSEGLGEALGRTVEESQFACRELSLAAAAWRSGIPLTVHVSIGSDIIHAHRNCDGAALGQASYTDFLIFAHTISQLEGGVYLNVGTSVTGPEVYLKALSMARNVARQKRAEIRHFTTAVFDLMDLPGNFRHCPPAKSDPLYYFRPWKTILVRTVADGGQSYYFCGDHRFTLPTLWSRLSAARLRNHHAVA